MCGTGLQKSDFTEAGVGCIHYGQIHTRYDTWTDKTKPCISPEFAARLRKARTSGLVNDLSSGLPAEIKAYRQQYEHYRDLLLNFPQPQTDNQGGMK